MITCSPKQAGTLNVSKNPSQFPCFLAFDPPCFTVRCPRLALVMRRKSYRFSLRGQTAQSEALRTLDLQDFSIPHGSCRNLDQTGKGASGSVCTSTTAPTRSRCGARSILRPFGVFGDGWLEVTGPACGILLPV
jgi:hypothetical protein